MDQPSSLLGDHSCDIRIAVAKRIDGDTSHAIEVTAARSIEQINTLAAIKHKIRALVGLQHIVLLVRDRVVGGHGGSFFVSIIRITRSAFLPAAERYSFYIVVCCCALRAQQQTTLNLKYHAAAGDQALRGRPRKPAQ